MERPPLPSGGRPRPVPTELLWHGIGPDERDVLAPLARTAAARGLLVLVPDWRSVTLQEPATDHARVIMQRPPPLDDQVLSRRTDSASSRRLTS